MFTSAEVKISPRSLAKREPVRRQNLSGDGVRRPLDPPPIASDGMVPAFVGVFEATEFSIARSVILGLRTYADYNDWLDVREGLQIGLAMAGVDARIIRIELSSFLAWCGRAGRQPSEEALDAFAAVVGLARRDQFQV